MGLLDKLRPQPRWKHADPAVRLEALRELDDPLEVAALAETDPDVKVRRAAIVRTSDAPTLGRIATTDADTEARDRAADRLLALATASDSDDGTALAATSHLGEPRRLSLIAKSDAAEPIRTEALSRTTDPRSIGGIARHAKHESTASAALDRLTDTAELLNVAQNCDHRDVAMRAFERVVTPAPDLALLRSIESRAQQKAVSKRARTMIQEIEDAETARRQAEEDRARQRTAVLEGIERLADVADTSRAAAELARLTSAWHGLGAADATAASRFSLGVSNVEAAIERRQREAEEALEHARMRAEALATREALCVRVETLDGDEILEHLVPVEEEWRSLAPLVGNGPEADRLAERFAKAVAACRKRHDMGAELVKVRAQLEALVIEAEGLPSRPDAASAATRWQALSREARGLATTLTEASRPVTDVADRLGVVERAFEARETARHDAQLKTRQDFVTRVQRLADRAKRGAEADTITLREGERLMRDIGAGLDEINRAADKDVKDDKDVSAVAASLRMLQEQVAPRVRELRELDDWRRFANGQQQEQLIAMAEAIVLSLKSDEEAAKTSDLAATARALKELHTRWGDVAEAPRQSAQRLWDRFRTATDFIRSRCEAYFAKMREERGTNLQRKTKLVEEAEALAQSTQWGKATARLQELQAEWQQTGPTPRDGARDLAQRFRTACNLFFTRRRDDLVSRKKTWTDSLTRKEALCARAETLAESTDWDASAAEMKRLQAEWKTIGPVRRSQSEAIWNRFRAAADRFFERFHNRHQITVAGKLAEREALVVELEQLVAAEDAPADLADRIQQLRATWYRSVPIAVVEMTPLANRWQTAFAATVERWPDAFKGTDLDPAMIRQKMEKLVARVESLLGDMREQPEGRSQAEMLAAKLRSALASNAMGGRANEESKWRAAADGVKDAQAAWQRLAPLGGSEVRALEARFRDACRRVSDQARRHTVSTKRPVKQTAAAV